VPPPQFADAASVAAAGDLSPCGGCHGDAGISGGVLPDLRASAALAAQSAWVAIVLDGSLSARGMVAFARELAADDAEAVRAYVIERARETSDAQH
jgi:mono/diheme cytochrome c family protein